MEGRPTSTSKTPTSRRNSTKRLSDTMKSGAGSKKGSKASGNSDMAYSISLMQRHLMAIDTIRFTSENNRGRPISKTLLTPVT